MSGICGIVALDGIPPSEAEIRALTTVLEQRGPDGTRVWLNGPIAMGHTLLATTPEALIETLPLTHRETGCTITADARIDNRDELLEVLGLIGCGRAIGDGELILLAYLKWGKACPQWLAGDYAFAIWDPRNRQLFCARDRFGVRQLAYWHDGKRIIFANDPGSLVKGAKIDVTINPERVADFLQVGLCKADYSKTWFSEIKLLPPGCILVCSHSGLRVATYWRLSPGSELRLSSDGEYLDAFLEIFSRAVKARLRSAKTVGVMLSGGLDSGSIALVARQIATSEDREIVTISALGTDPSECVESQAILERTAGLQTNNLYVTPGDFGRFSEDLIGLSDFSLDPFDCDLTMLGMIYHKAREAGCNVVLDGMAGDVTVGGASATAELLRRGKLGAYRDDLLAEEIMQAPHFSRMRRIRSDASRAFAPHWWRSFRSRQSVRRAIEYPSKSSFATASLARMAVERNLQGTGEYYQPDKKLSFAEQRARLILHTSTVGGRGCYDRMAASAGVEARDPFLDQRLVEFCLTLPPEQLRAKGQDKAILRRLFDRLTGSGDSWQPRKMHVGWSYNIQLLEAGSFQEIPPNESIDVLKGIVLENPLNDNGHEMQLTVEESVNARVQAYRLEVLRHLLRTYTLKPGRV